MSAALRILNTPQGVMEIVGPSSSGLAAATSRNSASSSGGGNGSGNGNAVFALRILDELDNRGAVHVAPGGLLVLSGRNYSDTTESQILLQGKVAVLSFPVLPDLAVSQGPLTGMLCDSGSTVISGSVGGLGTFTVQGSISVSGQGSFALCCALAHHPVVQWMWVASWPKAVCSSWRTRPPSPPPTWNGERAADLIP